MSGREVQGVAGCSPGRRGPTRPGVVYDGNDREVVTERPSHDDSRSSPLRLLLDRGRVRYRNFRCSMRPPGTAIETNSSLSLMASPVFGSLSLPSTLRDGLRDICQRGAPGDAR